MKAKRFKMTSKRSKLGKCYLEMTHTEQSVVWTLMRNRNVVGNGSIRRERDGRKLSAAAVAKRTAQAKARRVCR